MAIALAADLDPDGADHLAHPVELPWPRPVLRLVEPHGDPARRAASNAPLEHLPTARAVTEVSARRQRRALRRTRQRRVVATVVVAGALAVLSLPLAAVAGRPVTARPAAWSTATAGALTYVVQPGDTLWSIASRFDRGGDPRALTEQLEAETGSATVLPGERLSVP